MVHYKLFESGWHSHIDASGGDWSPPKETYVAWNMNIFFPAWQVIVSRFYQSCFRLLLPPSPPAASDYALAASSRSQCALPDLNRERQMPVVTARPGRQLREPGLSGHQDPNCKRKMSHWMSDTVPEEMSDIMPVRESVLRMPDDMSYRMPKEFPGRMSPDEMSNGMPGIMPS